MIFDSFLERYSGRLRNPLFLYFVFRVFISTHIIKNKFNFYFQNLAKRVHFVIIFSAQSFFRGIDLITI